MCPAVAGCPVVMGCPAVDKCPVVMGCLAVNGYPAVMGCPVVMGYCVVAGCPVVIGCPGPEAQYSYSDWPAKKERILKKGIRILRDQYNGWTSAKICSFAPSGRSF